MNSGTTSANKDGIAVWGDSYDMLFSGNRCFDDQATKTQRYGIYIRNSNVDKFIILGNDCIGNASGGINAPTGANKIKEHNLE